MYDNRNFTRCKFCKIFFRPDRKSVRKSGKNYEYIECPRCGNGYQQRARIFNPDGSYRYK